MHLKKKKYPRSQGGFWVFCEVPEIFSDPTLLGGSEIFDCNSLDVFPFRLNLPVNFLKGVRRK